MATKLLNIDKDDSIENVIDLLTSNEADTFMLVVPRGHKAFKNPNEISFLKEKSIELGKRINIMTSDKQILANLISLEIPYLEDKVSKSTKSRAIPPRPSDALLVASPKTRKPAKPAKGKKSSKPSLAIEEIMPQPERYEIEIESGKEQEREIEIRKFMSEKTEEEPDLLQKAVARKKQISFPKLNSRKIYISIGIVALLLLFLAGSSTLSKTKVTIKPQKLPLDLNLSVTAKEGLLGINSQDNAIPGKVIVAEKEVSGTFDSTGEKELNEKAKGTITVYNKFSSAPQTLVATTRFESPSGLVFRIPKTIAVPGAKIENGKTTPGSIETEVIADKPGAEYNIEPSDFTIPGLKGSPKYDGFYAKSFSKMSGGAVGKTKFVTEDDFNKAKLTLESELKKEIETRLRQGFVGQEKILPESQTTEIFITPDSNKAGDHGETFKLALKAKISTLAFDEKDIKTLAQYYYNDKIQKQTPLADTLDISYSNVVFRPEIKRLSFNAKIIGEAAYKIDDKKIAKEILGKKTAQVQDYFRGQDSIESARIVITPFWSSKITDNPSKIEVKIEY